MKAAGAAATLNIIRASVLEAQRKPVANERIALWLVGAGGKGTDLMHDFERLQEVQFVAVADPDKKHAERAKALAEKNSGTGCSTYSDFR